MKPTVTVTGFGRASARADSMLVHLGVQGEGDDVAAALDAASEALPRVIATLRAGGVNDRDLATNALSVDERYDHEKNRHSGYVCRNELRVVLRDLGASGRILRDVATAGGDALRIHGVSLQIGDVTTLAVQARHAAFTHARLQAEQYAQLARARLGEVLDVHDSAGTRPRDAARGWVEQSRALGEPFSVPVEAGELSEQATVTVSWELLR